MSRTDVALLVIRLTVGLTLLVHAYNHAFGPGGLDGTARWFAGLGMRRPKLQAVLSAAVEAAAGAGVAAGFLTPIAAGALAGVMIVAGWTAHRKNGFFVFRDGYEYVLVIGLTAAALGIAGPGKLSVDHVLGLDGRLSGWIGLAIIVVAGVGGAVAQLLTFWRPATPSVAEPLASTVQE
jgi:putative oxidoreductase